ncbi:3-hydroxyacyl-CoA dehydrogenase NAD-binding domain-containing protein [Profundibacter sp.]
MAQVAAIIGGGVIGGGWAARFLLMGWEVRVFDPDPQAQHKIGKVLENARRSLPGLSDVMLPDEGALVFCETISQAVDGAIWIQESIPERLELKHKVYQKIQTHCGMDAVIGSSTSGFKPSELQNGATRPEQIMVTHPFNPAYLLPLIELVPTDKNPSELIENAKEILTGIGMYPLHVRAETDAHIADRFLEAVWREALWLIKDGIATTEEIDDAIRYGFGLLWAQMGLFETGLIAGDEAGMRHSIDQITGLSDAHTTRKLERIRDNNLVAILRSLKAQDYGAGALLNAQDARQPVAKIDITQPIQTVARAVPLDWTDYNGHMNEARYLQAFGDGTDRFMEIVGCDADYIASGGSYFTAETHICHLDEVRAGARIRVETQCLLGEGKKMHLFHRMWEGERLLATGEHMLIHVSLETRRASVPADQIATRLGEIAGAHAKLDIPDRAGRAIGVR